jgi:hypothetical protein
MFRERQRVAEIYCVEYSLNLMVPIRPSAEDLQPEIDLGWAAELNPHVFANPPTPWERRRAL